jgi:hypothetical protein
MFAGGMGIWLNYLNHKDGLIADLVAPVTIDRIGTNENEQNSQVAPISETPATPEAPNSAEPPITVNVSTATDLPSVAPDITTRNHTRPATTNRTSRIYRTTRTTKTSATRSPVRTDRISATRPTTPSSNGGPVMPPRNPFVIPDYLNTTQKLLDRMNSYVAYSHDESSGYVIMYEADNEEYLKKFLYFFFALDFSNTNDCKCLFVGNCDVGLSATTYMLTIYGEPSSAREGWTETVSFIIEESRHKNKNPYRLYINIWNDDDPGFTTETNLYFTCEQYVWFVQWFEPLLALNGLGER